MSPPAGFYIYIIAERSSALWASAYAHTWSGPLPDASAEVLRSKCVEAEARMAGWRRASRGDRPLEMPLPGMLDVQLTPGVGVSLHEGKLLRLWDAASGERLGCKQLQREPTCHHLLHEHVAIGDVSGLLTLEPTDFAGKGQSYRAMTSAVTGVLLFDTAREANSAHSEPTVLAAGEDGVVCWSPREAELFSLGPPGEPAPAEAAVRGRQGAKYALADAGDGRHVVCRGPSIIGALDVHRAQWAWHARVGDDAAIGCSALASEVGEGAGARFSRPVCTSAELGLWGSCHADAVRLWDVRQASAIATLPSCGRVRHLQFDRGCSDRCSDGYGGGYGGGGSGAVNPHLLLASSQLLDFGANVELVGVCVLDIRRLDRAPRGMLVTTLSIPRGGGHARGGAASTCFDALGGVVVAARSAKSGLCAYRWQNGTVAAAAPVQAEEPAEQPGASVPRSARGKPKRQASGAKGRNNGAPGGGRRKQ